MPPFYMFAAADLFIFKKVDVLPKMDRCIAHACSVKLGLREIVLSASSGQNLESRTIGFARDVP